MGGHRRAHHNGVAGIELFDVDALIGLSEIRDQRHVTSPSSCEGLGLGMFDSSVAAVGATLLQDNCVSFSLDSSGHASLANVTINSTSGDAEVFLSTGDIDDLGNNVCGFDIGTPGEVVVACSSLSGGAPQVPDLENE